MKSSICLLMAKLTATLLVFLFPSWTVCYLSPAILRSATLTPNPLVPALVRAKPLEQHGLVLLGAQYMVDCFGQ